MALVSEDLGFVPFYCLERPISFWLLSIFKLLRAKINAIKRTLEKKGKTVHLFEEMLLVIVTTRCKIFLEFNIIF